MIYEGKDAWYADAGGLTKIVCEQKADKVKKDMSEDECCACDEAKYNVSLTHVQSIHSKLNNFAVFASISVFPWLEYSTTGKNFSSFLKESGRMRRIQRITRLLFG